jgi:hypothetical protein
MDDLEFANKANIDAARRFKAERDVLVKALELIEYASRKDSLTDAERLESVRSLEFIEDTTPQSVDPAHTAKEPDEDHPDCVTDRECELYDALMGLASAVMSRRREWDNWMQGGVQVAPIVRRALRLDASAMTSTEGK